MRRIFAAVLGLTTGLFCSARETVECETPATRATSLMEAGLWRDCCMVLISGESCALPQEHTANDQTHERGNQQNGHPGEIHWDGLMFGADGQPHKDCHRRQTSGGPSESRS